MEEELTINWSLLRRNLTYSLNYLLMELPTGGRPRIGQFFKKDPRVGLGQGCPSAT